MQWEGVSDNTLLVGLSKYLLYKLPVKPHVKFA